MKKITAAILAFTIVLSVAGCNKNNNPTDETASEEVTEKATEEIIEKETDEVIIVDDELGDKENVVKPVEKDDKKDDKKEEVKEDKKEEVKEDKKEDTTPEESVKKDETLGNMLLSYFMKEAKNGKTSMEIAEGIANLPEILFACQTSEMEKGWFPGFKEDIENFDSAVRFAPIIGSIPFVGYIFEVENPDEFIKEIKPLANLRWNICTEAEEMVVGKSGNKVFFVMCNKSLEDE